MQGGLRHFFLLLLHLGAGGLFLLGILDSSFLFMPLGNDLLLTALTINHRERLPLFVLMASGGSCAGVFLLDLVARKGGEVGLKRLMSQRRFEFLKRKMTKHAALPVALAAIAPPPFPFTPVIATASAFHYPRLRLLTMVLIARMIRFTAVGLLAIHFGRQILRLARTDVFLGIMIALILISLVGSTLSIIRWVRQSRKVERR
jgi:membrane protein YqaA with SNARE-associated domain